MSIPAAPVTRPKPVLLIDASIYIFQYYFSLPDHWFSLEESWPTAAVYGYTAFLVRLLEQQQPERIAACFDESLGSCFRNEIYSGYKSSRALPDEALAFQLDACRQVSELMGIACFASQTHEADDLLGSLYQAQMRSKVPVAILTRDKDLGQLLRRPQDFLWDYAAKTASTEHPTAIGRRYSIEAIYDKFGVRPQQLADYLALVGDSIDDIPGVPGVGPQTARALLHSFESVHHLLRGLDQVAELPLRGAAKLAVKLDQHRDQIEVSRQLATIVCDLPLIDSVKRLQWQQPQWQALERFCQQMGFARLYKRIKILHGMF